MKKTKSLVGRKYGKLLVLAETNKLEARYKVWECRCECGKITFVNTKKLKRGTITNCGCIPKNKDRSLATYGNFSNRKKNTEVSETGLMHGQYVGCGCRKKRLLKVFIIIFI